MLSIINMKTMIDFEIIVYRANWTSTEYYLKL
jgi:hypothetical protein